MGAFLTSVPLDFSRAFLPEMKKDRLGAIPNRSYHHIQRANCDFPPGIVASTRYFQLFLSKNIKRITQTLYQYLRDWMANPVDCDTTDGCTLPGAGMGAMHLIQQAHIRIPISNSYYFGRRINAH